VIRAETKPKSELRRVGLRYVSDNIAGLARQRRGRTFSYFTSANQPVTQSTTLQRIRSLVIPPAWTKVWISPFADGHLQATGRDARGRKQYRYHPDFRQHQENTKFTNILEFAQALPGIRRQVARDLNHPGLPRERVIATIVRLLERTLIRVGNREYAEHNHSFGLSTLQNKHIHRCGSGVRFTFMGKSGVPHNVEVADRTLARIVFRCHDLPGQHLFEYQDHQGKVHAINSSDVNDYIRQSSDSEFSARNFRTWKGTVLAALAFEKLKQPKSPTALRNLISQVVKDVALELRNTPATCRKYYVHPALITAFQKASFHRTMRLARSRSHQRPLRGLSHDETAVLWFLKHAARS
jgi:DNA topoisomerase I